MSRAASGGAWAAYRSQAERALREGHVLASPFPAPRGTQGYLAELLRAQIERGHEVHLFCYAGVLAGQSPEGLVLHRARKIPGVPAALGSRPGLSRPLNDLALLSRLLVDPELGRLDLLHGHNHEGGLAALVAGRLRGLRVVHQVHGNLEAELLAWAQTFPRPMGGILRLIAPGAGLLFDRRLPGLGDACLRLRPTSQGAGGTAGTVLPVGISVPAAGPSELSRVQLPHAGPWVVYAGNLDPYQDLPLLFAVHRLLQGRAPAPRLLLVSHDPPGRVRALLHEAGVPPEIYKIINASDVGGAARWIAVADLMLVPRRDPGGLPLKILNAIGLEIPVVATQAAAAGLGEAEGVVATEAQAEALAAGVRAVLDDAELRVRLQAGARAFARARPWGGVAGACEAVYARVLV